MKFDLCNAISISEYEIPRLNLNYFKFLYNLNWSLLQLNTKLSHKTRKINLTIMLFLYKWDAIFLLKKKCPNLWTWLHFTPEILSALYDVQRTLNRPLYISWQLKVISTHRRVCETIPAFSCRWVERLAGSYINFTMSIFLKVPCPYWGKYSTPLLNLSSLKTFLEG